MRPYRRNRASARRPFAQSDSTLRTWVSGRCGYRLPAADCHADAALLARRAGLDPTGDEAEARRLYTACGAVPLLGELPEARWTGAAETTARPA